MHGQDGAADTLAGFTLRIRESTGVRGIRSQTERQSLRLTVHTASLGDGEALDAVAVDGVHEGSGLRRPPRWLRGWAGSTRPWRRWASVTTSEYDTAASDRGPGDAVRIGANDPTVRIDDGSGLITQV